MLSCHAAVQCQGCSCPAQPESCSVCFGLWIKFQLELAEDLVQGTGSRPARALARAARPPAWPAVAHDHHDHSNSVEQKAKPARHDEICSASR